MGDGPIFPSGIVDFSIFFLLLRMQNATKSMETLRKIARFYIDGFREMTLGRTLWAIILLKLFILFAVLRLFFFPDLLAGKDTEERADYVLENLIPEN